MLANHSGPVPGVTGLGYSGGGEHTQCGGGAGGAPWDRGANLKEYYSKRDEMEAQAVRPPTPIENGLKAHGDTSLTERTSSVLSLHCTTVYHQ